MVIDKNCRWCMNSRTIKRVAVKVASIGIPSREVCLPKVAAASRSNVCSIASRVRINSAQSDAPEMSAMLPMASSVLKSLLLDEILVRAPASASSTATMAFSISAGVGGS